jgi:sugar/nucleoside kinase (ribokinase family)
VSQQPILVVGSVALDSIRTPFGEAQDAFGGSATYFSLAARYFAPVRLVAVVGEDLPNEHRDMLHGRGIDIRGLEVTEGDTFRWGGVYGSDLNTRETLFTHLNVFEHFHPKVPQEFRSTPYVFLGNIHPTLQLEVLDQIDKPRLVALDTMNLWIDTARADLERVLRRVDLFILNDSEARDLGGTANLVSAGKRLLELGPQTIIIKKGEHGALMITEDSMFATAALPLEDVCDPTGAGDAFAGGVLGYLASRNATSPAAMRHAIAYGTVIASFVVQGFGVDGIHDLEHRELDERFERLRHLTHFEPIESLQSSSISSSMPPR